MASSSHYPRFYFAAGAGHNSDEWPDEAPELAPEPELVVPSRQELVPGVEVLDLGTPARLLGHPRYITGGYVVDVEATSRPGLRWSAVLENLRIKRN